MSVTKTEPTGAERAAIEARRGLGRIDRLYAVEGIELRAVGDDSPVRNFFGHAAVTGKGYEMYGGPEKGGWTEFVDPGAFKRTLGRKPDVAFLVNHTGMTLARTKAGTLTLAEDSVGLKVDADLDTRVSLVNDLVLLMEAGNLDEMSFAFRVAKQQWLDVDGEEVPWWDLAGIERHITEVNIDKGDVSVVNYGANPFTDAALRSLTDTLADLVADRDSLDEGELRAAIAQLTALLPESDPTLDAQQAELELRHRRLAQLAPQHP